MTRASTAPNGIDSEIDASTEAILDRGPGVVQLPAHHRVGGFGPVDVIMAMTADPHPGARHLGDLTPGERSRLVEPAGEHEKRSAQAGLGKHGKGDPIVRRIAVVEGDVDRRILLAAAIAAARKDDPTQYGSSETSIVRRGVSRPWNVSTSRSAGGGRTRKPLRSVLSCPFEPGPLTALPIAVYLARLKPMAVPFIRLCKYCSRVVSGVSPVVR